MAQQILIIEYANEDAVLIFDHVNVYRRAMEKCLRKVSEK